MQVVHWVHGIEPEATQHLCPIAVYIYTTRLTWYKVSLVQENS